MSQSWVRGPVCGVDNCTSRLYRSVDGLKVCQYGHVMEGNIEINDDQDDNFVQTKRLNINLTGLGGDFLNPQLRGASQLLRAPETQKLYGAAAREMYLQCVQCVLEGQTQTVVRLFLGLAHAVAAELITTVKLYWVQTLESCLVPKPKRGRDAELDLADPYVHLPVTIDLVAVIYLALLTLRLPVYLHSLYSAIRVNRVPYMKCIHLVPRRLLDRLPPSYIHLLEPQKLPQSNELYEAVHLIIKRVGVTLIEPSWNYYFPLVFQTYQLLHFPNAPELFWLTTALASQLCLFEKGTYKRKETQLALKAVAKMPRFLLQPKGTVYQRGVPRGKIIDFPELRVASIVIFTIKFYYASHDASTPLVDPQVWLNNVHQYELNHEFPISQTNNVEEELLNWCDNKINRYCQWVYKHLVPKKSKTFNLPETEGGDGVDEELLMMEKRLYQIFDIDEQEYASAGKRSLDVESAAASDDVFGGYEGGGSSASAAQIRQVEAKLITKFCLEFGVTDYVMRGAYNELEGYIKAQWALTAR
jgi:RNA polymerase I-specific transcription initiation factor RRN7